MKKNKGLVYVFYGNGKGKTSAALGVACRSLLRDKKVVWISWFKEESWKTAEMSLVKKFKKNLEMYWMGKGFFGGSKDHTSPEKHKEAAHDALSLAERILRKEDAEVTVELLVLDEIIKAVNDGLLTEVELLELIRLRKCTHLILTGHKLPQGLEKYADLITEMKKIKHPYDKGVLAVQGLDF